MELLREQKEMVQTGRGVYHVEETILKGTVEEIEAERTRVKQRYGMDRRCVQLSTHVVPTFHFNGTTFETTPLSILHVFVILTPQTL